MLPLGEEILAVAGHGGCTSRGGMRERVEAWAAAGEGLEWPAMPRVRWVERGASAGGDENGRGRCRCRSGGSMWKGRFIPNKALQESLKILVPIETFSFF